MSHDRGPFLRLGGQQPGVDLSLFDRSQWAEEEVEAYQEHARTTQPRFGIRPLPYKQFGGSASDEPLIEN